MKKSAVAWVILAAVGCGSSSPTQPTERPIPAARIIGVGSLTTLFGSSVNFKVRNEGPGCAITTDLAGSITITTNNGASGTSAWELTLGSKTVGNFKPGMELDATTTITMPSGLSGDGRATVTVSKQTNVACDWVPGSSR